MIPKSLVAASFKPFVLSVLAEGESYGYHIIQRIHSLSDGKLKWATSTLYPVLHSLENQGLLESNWRAVEDAPRRKYYRLTDKGLRALSTEREHWMDVHLALMKLWQPRPDYNLAID